MSYLKKIINLWLLFLLVFNQGIFTFCFANKVHAAFDVKGVQLFKDNNVCINKASSGTITTEALDLATLQSNSESVQSRISSGGSLCPIPPFFVGGAILTTTSGITIQAQPNVQSLGRGILISEVSGDSGGVSSSGDPRGFKTVIDSFGGTGSTIFEISLPSGCDVIDDDDDIVGASTDLANINDFSFITCQATNGLTVKCNEESGLLTAKNALVPVVGSSPALIRFVLSDFGSVNDTNMIDSVLIKLDSQDVFCPSTVSGSLTASIIAKNKVDSPTKTETVGTVDLGLPAKPFKLSYTNDVATSTKGEVSTNEVSATPLLISSGTTIANKLQIEELHNESIPVGGQVSPILINPSVSNSNEITRIDLWLIPSKISLFSSVPSDSDIIFSDTSLVLNSSPFIVKNNGNDGNAPIGTLVIPIKKNVGSTDPQKVKSIITIKNLKLNNIGTEGSETTLTLAVFEPTSGAVVNTPVALSVNNSSTSITNPQNFSAFSVASTRGTVQNAIVGGSANEVSAANQITTDSDLDSSVKRSTTLGAPQITGFTKTISKVTDLDASKITVNSTAIMDSTEILANVKADPDASISGAKINIQAIQSDKLFDEVTITSKGDGSFNAGLRASSFQGTVTLRLKQKIGDVESKEITKSFVLGCAIATGCGGESCITELCDCPDQTCTPTLTTLFDYIKAQGGLIVIVSAGGSKLNSVIKSAKKVLGLS